MATNTEAREPTAEAPAAQTEPRLAEVEEAPPSGYVLVIGSINMDLVVRTDRMPRPGETVRGSDFAAVPGGKGANQAVAVARLGGKSVMAGRVGEDMFGTQLLMHLRQHHVNTRHVRRTHACPSGTALITVDASGENAITIIAGSNGMLCPDDIEALEPVIAAARVVVMQLEIPLPTVRLALRLARKHEVFTILDPAPVPPEGLSDDLVAVDLFTPNQTEAELITGQPVPSVARAKLVGAQLIDRGARHVVIKLGDQGAMIVSADGTVLHVPAFEVPVVDSTAAGDAFTGALAVAKVEDMPLEPAVRFACAAGALACTKFGAEWSIPMRADVDQLLQRRC